MLLVFLAVTGVAWSALRLLDARGALALPLPWPAVPGLLLLAGVVLAAGWPVRRWVRGERDRQLDPLVAARTVVLAKAACYAGAALAGWYLAQGLILLPALVGDRRSRFVVALLCVLASVALAGAGLLVQRWCRVPPDDQDPGAAGRARRAAQTPSGTASDPAGEDEEPGTSRRSPASTPSAVTVPR